MESGFDNFYMNRRGLNSIHTAFSIFGLPFQNIPSKFHSHGILLIFDHFIFHRLGSSGGPIVSAAIIEWNTSDTVLFAARCAPTPPRSS